MTEKEWLREVAIDSPSEMLYALADEFPPRKMKCTRKSRERKLRLFGCAACRRLWHLLVCPETQTLIEVVERYADDEATDKELAKSHKKAQRAQLPEPPDGEGWSPIYGAYDYAKRAADILGGFDYPKYVPLLAEDLYGATVNDPDDPEEEHKHQKALLLDIFGNPFRPMRFDKEWRTGTAVALAQQMYESRDFGAMPILADALQDAGCEDKEVLKHCRNAEQVHVRGCWVVDLVLGKA